MSKDTPAHQIEELLLSAHLESEEGVDLIEEYFNVHSSLDRVTECAEELLSQEFDREIQGAIVKNLAECIVVKNQRDQRSLFGIAKRHLQKWGLSIGKGGEIKRAESLLESYRKSSEIN